MLAIPRRPHVPTPQHAAAVNHVLSRPNAKRYLTELQSFALAEFHDNGGRLFGMMGVGSGKTPVSFAAKEVVPCKRPLLVTAAALVPQTETEYADWSNDLKLPTPFIDIISYDLINSTKRAEMLNELAPDLIVFDEAHKLKNRRSIRTRRVLKYLKANSATKLMLLSGTMTTKSLFDFAHLLELTHPGAKHPLPLMYPTLEEWECALSPDAEYGAFLSPLEPGALMMFCEGAETARDGVRRRLIETSGIVASAKSSCDASIVIRSARPTVPKNIYDALKVLHKTGATPSGEISLDTLDAPRHARELSQGFYYRWVWPGGKVDHEWLDLRAAWHQELRAWLHRDLPGRDSPALIVGAIQRGEFESIAYGPWAAVKDRFAPLKTPPRETIWLSRFLVDYACEWLKTSGDAIVWYDDEAVGLELAACGIDVYRGAPDAARLLETAKRGGQIACSIGGNKEGRNLQHWSNMLVLNPPSDAGCWEQLIGRVHRTGQTADEITVDVCVHTDELSRAFAKARARDDYRRSMESETKFARATFVGF